MLLDRFLNFSPQGLQSLASNYHQRRAVEWTFHHFRPSNNYSHVPLYKFNYTAALTCLNFMLITYVFSHITRSVLGLVKSRKLPIIIQMLAKECRG